MEGQTSSMARNVKAVEGWQGNTSQAAVSFGSSETSSNVDYRQTINDVAEIGMAGSGKETTRNWSSGCDVFQQAMAHAERRGTLPHYQQKQGARHSSDGRENTRIIYFDRIHSRSRKS